MNGRVPLVAEVIAEFLGTFVLILLGFVALVSVVWLALFALELLQQV